MQWRLWAGLWAALAVSIAAGVCLPSFGQAPDPVKIVRDGSWNELHSKGHPFRYLLLKQTSKGSTLKEIIETHDGDVARLIARDGKPLSPEEERAEEQRLRNLAANPAIQAHRRAKEKQDNARGDEMVRMLPDAFLYTYEGTVQGPIGLCYKLAFKPNPSFVPPDREGEVYHGMEGELWVDRNQLRMVRLDAHLISDVNFGWGFLGRLYKGGNVLVEDTDVGRPFGVHQWETLLMRLRLRGKVLMMKSVDFSETETASGFKPVSPNLSYKDAVRILQAEQPAKDVP